MNEITLTIDDISRGGAGMGRDAEGRAVFVPKTAPGDVVRVAITRVEKRYSWAKLIELITPSPQRVKPKCSVFDRCGGCEWQHLAYETQWKTKAAGVLHALKRIGLEKDRLPSLEELPAQQIWGYRNRIQLRGEGGKLGFFEPGSRNRVEIESCPVARPEINSSLPSLREKGLKLPREYKVEVEVLPNGQVRDIWNARHAAMGFRQVHDEQNQVLQHWVASCFEGPAGGLLLDLYGGSGNLSLGLASSMREVRCVDVGEVQLPEGGVPSHFHFHRTPVANWLGYFKLSKPGPEGDRRMAILDPPREGFGPEAETIVRNLERLRIGELALVGCDPDSFARDVSRLFKKGWTVERLAVLDLFPQTSHVESLAYLKRTF